MRKGIRSGKKPVRGVAKRKAPAAKPTRVIVKYDVGFNNNLYIRGQGAGLSWERGILLSNTGPDEWMWESTLPCNECEFKVLINDQQYETGENRHVAQGVTVQYTPYFS